MMLATFNLPRKIIILRELNVLKEKIKAMGEKGAPALVNTTNFVSIMSKNP